MSVLPVGVISWSKIPKNGIFEDLRARRGWKTAQNGFFRQFQPVF
jgi:hypothetical protein